MVTMMVMTVMMATMMTTMPKRAMDMMVTMMVTRDFPMELKKKRLPNKGLGVLQTRAYYPTGGGVNPASSRNAPWLHRRSQQEK